MRMQAALLVMMGVAVGSVMAQSAAPSGTVDGTVTFGDTQRPARLAKVTLTPVKSDPNAGLAALEKKKDSDVNIGQAMGALMGSVTMFSGQTDAQGRYELTNVPPGDYYVLANVPGYVSSSSMGDVSGGGVDLSGAPVVHVDADHTAHGDVTLARGAAVDGRVTYDDGSPVPGVAVMVESTKKQEKKPGEMDFGKIMTAAMSGGLRVATTDDRGEYRVAGLPAGEYRVKVTVALTGSTSMHGGVILLGGLRGASSMLVYAPATLHTAEAKKIVLKNGDDLRDVDVEVNLAGLHTVSGHVASAVDHHLLNSGTVTLVDVNDKEVKRGGVVQRDGSFTIEYVPSGSYTLKVDDAADTVPSPRQKPTGLLNFEQDKVVKSYDDQSLPEIVADQDVTGINVELKESTTVKQAPNLNGLFGGGVGR